MAETMYEYVCIKTLYCITEKKEYIIDNDDSIQIISANRIEIVFCEVLFGIVHIAGSPLSESPCELRT